MVEFLQKHRTVILNLEKTIFVKELYKTITSVIYNYLKDIFIVQKENCTSNISTNLIVKFYAGGLNALFLWWIENQTISTEEFTNQFDEILQLIKITYIHSDRFIKK